MATKKQRVDTATRHAHRETRLERLEREVARLKAAERSRARAAEEDRISRMPVGDGPPRQFEDPTPYLPRRRGKK